MEVLHPVQHLAFWATKADEIAEMKALYDELAGGDPTRQAKLDKLIGWAREERSCDDAYNDGEG